MKRYLRNLLRALRDEPLVPVEVLGITTRHANALLLERDAARKERDEANRSAVETIQAYCDRAREAEAEARADRKERDEARTRYETLVAECTRHRHATWEITHK